jgi:predicted TIM-barrel enzyme
MKGKTMKKLLLILSSASILVSAGTTSIFAISYNNQNDRVADEMIDVYSKTLAYAMRNSILLDVNNLDDT